MPPNVPSDSPFADPPDDDGQELPPEQPHDAASPTQRIRRQRRLVREATEAKQFWEGVFATEIGRREMWGILKAAGAFDVRFSHGPAGFPDPQATWFHFGQTQLGLWLYREWMKHARDGVLAMQDEHDERFKRPK